MESIIIVALVNFFVNCVGSTLRYYHQDTHIAYETDLMQMYYSNHVKTYWAYICLQYIKQYVVLCLISV